MSARPSLHRESTDSLIKVVKTVFVTFCRYSDVYVLQTFNTTGGITTYIGNVESDLTPHFISAGLQFVTH